MGAAFQPLGNPLGVLSTDGPPTEEPRSKEVVTEHEEALPLSELQAVALKIPPPAYQSEVQRVL